MENRQLSEVSPKNLVAQANALIKARYKATRNEEILLKSMMSLIDPRDEEFMTFTATTRELANILQLHPATAVREFDKITTRLMSRVIKIEEDEDNWEKFQWVSRASLKNGVVSLQFHDDLKPYLLALRKTGHFTQYRLEDVLWFRSTYTSRIYEMLIEANNKKQRFVRSSLIDFRYRMLGDKSTAYPLFKDFKKKVINVAQKELSQLDENGLYKSKLNFELLTHRTARKITELEFRVIAQQTAQKPDNAELRKTSDINHTPAAQALPDTPKTPSMEALEQHGIKGSTAQKYLDQQGEDEILRCVALLKDASNSGRIKTSESGYLLKLLEERAGHKTESEIRKKERQTQREAEEKEAKQEKIQRDRQGKLSLAFDKITIPEFLDTLSEQEKKNLLSTIKAENPDNAEFIRELDSGMGRVAVKSKIPNYETRKELYIQENLKN